MINATGNNYAGLWWPMLIAGLCFIIGTLLIKETKDVDISNADTTISVKQEAKARESIAARPSAETNPSLE